MRALSESSEPSVSVVIPTYQRRELLPRAVSSVLAQTFQDFELIVVDDGSTDGTREALEGLDDRIHYRWQENRGVAAARNVGIRLGRGEIVAFLDSDDRWLPDHLAVVTEVLARHPKAVLVCTCPRYRVAGRQRAKEARLVDLLPRLLLQNLLGYPACVAVRREALVAVEGFDERLLVWEDSDLWLRLALLGPFAILKRRTIAHRRSPDSLSEHGRRSGGYLRAFEVASPRAVEELERARTPEASRLVPAAQSVVQLVAALGALLKEDPRRARVALDEACRLWPELSRDVDPVVARVRHVASERRELARTLTAVAELWPEPQADTPLFLRAYAAVLALRGGRVDMALEAVACRGMLRNPMFVVRTFPVTARRYRRRVDELFEGWRARDSLTRDAYDERTTERR